MENKELKESLEDLKKSLGEAQNEKLKALESKSAEQIKAANDSVEELKKELADKQEELKSLQEWKVGKDEADKKNQEAIDKMIADRKSAKHTFGKEKSFGQIIKESIEEKTDELSKIARKESNAQPVSVELKAAGDVATSNVTGGNSYGDVYQNGIIMNPNRRVHIRELVGTGSIGQGTQYVYMREDGNGEGDPAPTSENGTKPQFDVDLKEASVDIETIAGWMRVTRKAMNNIPGFISFLQQRLPERLLNVEDNQLLKGDGTSPNISGITDTGNFTAATTTESILADRLTDSLAQLEGDEERTATGILLTPSDYFGFFKNKATGSGEYDLPANFSFVNGQLYISGVPVFKSSAANSGQFIVGDWQMGAQLLIQEGIRIEFFPQDTNNVQKNKVTVRIEENVAFPIYGDNYFIVGDTVATT